MNFSEVRATLYRQGLVDERKQVVFGVMECHQGEFSCIAGIKGNMLRIFKSDNAMNIGDLRFEFVIPNLNVTKARSFALAPKLAFEYGGKRFTLSHFGSAKEFIAAFTKERG